MRFILLAVAVSYSAVLIWLTVRVVNNKRRWAKRTLVALVAAPIVYVGSFGPACFLRENDVVSIEFIRTAYRPVIYLARSPRERRSSNPGLWPCLQDYAALCRGKWTVVIIELIEDHEELTLTRGEIRQQLKRMKITREEPE